MLRLTLHAEASPAEIFGAVLRHSNDEIAALIAAMDREVAPATHATLTGGWAGMASVRRARCEVLPNVALSTREQDVAWEPPTGRDASSRHPSPPDPDPHRPPRSPAR